MTTFEYIGKELPIFKHAVNWKKYFSRKIIPYIKGDVLEVGAGLGETSTFLMNPNVKSWTCLEPDATLMAQLKNNIPFRIDTIDVSLSELKSEKKYDTILYIDVLEHIANDVAEMEKAASFLQHNGHIIILSPSYNFLATEFDKEIGHFRRYNKRSLRNAFSTSKLKEEKTFYLESCGITLLLINKFITHKRYPSVRNIQIWDRFIVPISTFTDPILRYTFGKSIIGIWQKRL